MANRTAFTTLSASSPKELHRQLGELREKLRTLRFRVTAGQEKDVREIRATRHLIAQIMTALHRLPTKQEKTS